MIACRSRAITSADDRHFAGQGEGGLPSAFRAAHVVQLAELLADGTMKQTVPGGFDYLDEVADRLRSDRAVLHHPDANAKLPVGIDVVSVVGVNGTRLPSLVELEAARFQGCHVARLAGRVVTNEAARAAAA